jgi:hypothetical protein
VSTRPKRPRDTNQLAKLMVDILTGEVEDRERTPEERGVDPAASAMGKRGGPVPVYEHEPPDPVEGGSRDQAARNSRSQRGVVDQRTASRIDQNRGRLHASQGLSVDNLTILGRRRGMQRDEV